MSTIIIIPTDIQIVIKNVIHLDKNSKLCIKVIDIDIIIKTYCISKSKNKYYKKVTKYHGMTYNKIIQSQLHEIY